MEEIDPTELTGRADDVCILDVREPAEWQAGRIDGAVHIPMGDLPARIGELDADGRVVAVCRSGARSAHVTLWLSAQGYEAANLRGGMKAWRDAGLPVTTPDGSPGHVA